MINSSTKKIECREAKSPLRYAGGKTRAIPLLKQYLPDNLKTVCSPFIGGGSFELSLAAKGIQIYGYDNFEPLVDFWNHLVNNPEQLADKIQENYNIDKNVLRTWSKKIFIEQDSLMRAVMFFILNRTTYGGSTVNGGLYTDIYQRFNQAIIDRVRNFKVNGFHIGFSDFKASIPRHSDDFLYLDPPYVKHDRLYAYSKRSKDEFEHNMLYELVKNREGWILSYNDTEVIRERYSEFRIMNLNWKYGISNDSKKSSEILVLSPDIKVKQSALEVFVQ